MDQNDFVERRLDMLAIMTWVRIVLWLSLTLMLRNLTLLCQYLNGVLVRCLIYFMRLLQKSAENSIKISKTVSNPLVLSLIHLEAYVYSMEGWMTSYLRRDMPISHKGLLHILYKVRRLKSMTS